MALQRCCPRLFLGKLTLETSKILSFTFKPLYTAQPAYLYNLISLQPPRNTQSSSVVTLARPSTHSSLKITSRSFRYASPLLWNQPPHLPRQPRLDLSPPDSPYFHDHLTSSASPSPLLSSITPSFFHSNLKTSFSQILSSIVIWHPFGLTPPLFGPAHGFYVYSFQFFFWVLVFIIILHFLPFQFFSYFSCLCFEFCQFYI